ncbi:MAG: SusC/RagA family TonB-linked outer membrane protein [Prevotella sp.]|nr:SusC/RagA family TonB-linked outer membrane protein [Prevotella sp.]
MKKHILSAMMLLAGASVAAQDNLKVVTGDVVDAVTGKPMAGVIVAAYGDRRYSSMTDEQGHYELKVPDYTRSVLMNVDGYSLLQQAIAGDKADGRLYSSTAFSETYSRTTTATLSGQTGQFDNTSELSIDPLVAQRLGADMRTVSHGGIPGMGQMMLIQGINSLNANAQPLVVVDGVIMDMQYSRQLLHDGYFNNMLANLNVNDIESVEVLKNGTALYGAKGAGGVLLIKTKRNKSMATKIDLTINGRYELVPRLPEMMKAEDYRLYASQLLSGKMNPNQLGQMKFLNSEEDYFYYKQYYNETDWTDEVYENAFSQNYNINVQGGDNAASYNLSVGYSLGNSTLKENDYSRFNMRLNSDITVAKWLDVRFDASYSDVDRSLRDDAAPADPLATVITSPGFIALAKSPFLSPYAYDKHGRLSHYLAEADDYLEGKFQGKGRLANPKSILEHGDGKNRNSFGNRLITFAITPQFHLNKHLDLSEHFTLSLVNTNENYYLPRQGVPTFTVEGLDEDTYLHNIAQSMAARQTAIQSDTRLTWANRYGAHNVDVKAGLRFLSSEYTLTSQRGYDTSNDKTPNMSTSLRFKDTDGADDKTRELTWYALAGYDYASRFYANVGLSAQASSRFGDDVSGLHLGGVSWGLFPSIEGAWVLTNEKWLAGVKGIDYLRLNVGFDMTGNDDIDYTASRTYFVARRMLAEEATGKLIGNIGNTDLQWETTSRLTAGLTGNFLNNRLSVRLNLFKSWTSNLLSLRQLAWTSGLQQNWSNEGKLENAGFDVAVNAKVLALKDFGWELGASAGHYNNKVTALPNDDRAIKTNLYGGTIITQVGQPVGLFYGLKTEGVYTTAADAAADGYYKLNDNGNPVFFQAGDMRFYDRNGDGEIYAGDDREAADDRVVIGNPNPDIYGNISTTLSYKNLKLQAVMNYSLGNDVYNYERSLLEGGSLFLNQTTAMNYRWTTEGQQTDIPRVAYGDPMGNSSFSDRWIEDGSYLRLSSVTLSWYLPIQSTYLQGITIWGNASNLFTITRYLGSNPDCAMAGGILSQGIDRGLLSAGRSFSLGVNINL